MTFAEFRRQAGRHLWAVLAATLLATGCGGGSSGGGTTTTPPVSGSDTNVVAITLDSGPAGVSSRLANIPYVSVTVCPPGSRSGCQVIDHVIVDTGSYGLRLVASVLNNLSALPLQQNGAGSPYAECAQFVSGYTWGSVRTADLTVGGLTASSLPIQVIADPAFSSVPSSCSNTGTNQGSVAALGGNGMLGVGPFLLDCGNACASQAIAGTYYACTISTFCSSSAMPLAQQVANPVARLPSDNNGVVVKLPAVATGGASGVTGSLIFGIGTRSNNALGSATVYGVSGATGNFTTVYNARSYSRAFLDSGSNFLFFNDSTLPTCADSASGFYCPAATRSLTAQIQGTNNATGTVNFSISNASSAFNTNPGATAFSDIGATSSDVSTFDWGLPFFFGRSVFTALERASTPGGTGPFVAF